MGERSLEEVNELMGDLDNVISIINNSDMSDGDKLYSTDKVLSAKQMIWDLW